MQTPISASNVASLHRAPGDRLARGLGWFSLGLGVAQLAAPARVARLVGIEPRARRRATLFGVGLRELAAGLGILSRPRPAGWLGARVVGDLLDLLLLGLAFRARDAERPRLVGALSAVAGVLALDAIAARRHARHLRPGIAAITIARPPDEVARAWRALQGKPGVFFTLGDPAELLADPARASIAAAPGGRGTEVTVRAGGPLAASRARNDLRRLKQMIELGEVVHSDASIHDGPHAARPSGEEALR